jgi:WD40 repeat protein
MSDAKQIAHNLPPELQPNAPQLATALEQLSSVTLTPETIRTYLDDETIVRLLRALAGQTLKVGDDSITIGTIQDSKAVAVGTGSVAIADIIININQEAPPRTEAPFLAPSLPDGFVERPVEFSLIVNHLVHIGNTVVALSTALRGAGGFGKTTLAIAICHNDEVRAHFYDGILWVTLGEQPSLADLVGKIEDLVVILTGKPRAGFTTIEAAAAQLAEALTTRRILLVIDDVWNRTHLDPFLRGGPNCVRLMTTRNRNTLPPDTVQVDIDAMRQNEALQLLKAGLGEMTEYTLPLTQLTKRLGEWPLLLTLVNGVLREQIADGAMLADAIAFANQGLDEEGLTVFDMSSETGRQRAVSRTLNVSLTLLNDEERARFAELAIFPEDVDIPLTILQHYWGVNGAYSAFKVKQLCGHLSSHSLLLRYDVRAQTIRLHDVVRGYLIREHASHLPPLHTRLLDACRPGSGRWADMENIEPYLWDHLATHLVASGQSDELVTTMLDLHYLARKILRFHDTLRTEADLTVALSTHPDNTTLAQLKHIIANTPHLIRVCANEADLIATVAARLIDSEGICTIAYAALPLPYLAPLRLLPDLPEPALLRTLEGHSNRVTSCTWSPDGTTLASASEDCTLRLWDTQTGQLLHTLEGHSYQVNSCAWSPDGSTLASTSLDGTLRLWDTQTGQLLRTLKSNVNECCTWSPDGSTLALGSFNHTLQLWNAHNGQLLRTWSPNDTTIGNEFSQTTSCAWSPDGSTLASASHTLRLWDTQTGQLLRTLEGHTHWITSCAWSPNGSTLASGSYDGTLRLWDTQTGQLLHTRHTSKVTSCTWSPDGSTLASGSLDGTLRLWDTQTGQPLRTLEGHSNQVTSCAWSPDGSTLASASEDRTLRLWDTQTGQPLHTRHTSKVTSCTWSPDGSTLASVSEDRTLRLWDTQTGQALRTLEGHSHGVTSCAWSPDGSTLASGSYDGILWLWDTQTGQLLHTWNPNSTTLEDYIGLVARRPASCAWSPNGSTLASVSQYNVLRLWDTQTGQLLHTLESHTSWITSCAWSPDGSTLALGSFNHTLQLWNAQTGQLLHTWSPNSTTLDDNSNWGTSCAWSPDGSTFASASRTLRLWDVHNGQLLHTLEGHIDEVTSCAWSPDGSTLASASQDGTLRLWDIHSRTSLALLALDDELTTCTFHPNGNWLIAGGHKGIYWLQVVWE